jgi:hypothetical protein
VLKSDIMKNKIKLPKVDPTRVIKLNEGCNTKFNLFDVILNKLKK